jgi:hypothetical protein
MVSGTVNKSKRACPMQWTDVNIIVISIVSVRQGGLLPKRGGHDEASHKMRSGGMRSIYDKCP